MKKFAFVFIVLVAMCVSLVSAKPRCKAPVFNWNCITEKVTDIPIVLHPVDAYAMGVDTLTYCAATKNSRCIIFEAPDSADYKYVAIGFVGDYDYHKYNHNKRYVKCMANHIDEVRFYIEIGVLDIYRKTIDKM